jgi:hypothetical protein
MRLRVVTPVFNDWESLAALPIIEHEPYVKEVELLISSRSIV